MPTLVGVREWHVLGFITRYDATQWTPRKIRALVNGRNPSDWGRDIPPLLLERGLITHDCVPSNHPLGLDCPVSATSQAGDAQLSKRGKTWLRKYRADRATA